MVTFRGVAFGKGYWKLNNDVLAEYEYRESFRELFGNWVELKGLYEDRVNWWEDTKKRIKTFSIAYSTRRAQDD